MNTQEKNIAKLEQLLKVIDEGITKEEFVKAFENVVNLVLKIEKRNTEAVDLLEKTYSNLLEKIKNDHTSSLSDLKKQVDNVFVGKQLERILAEHKDKMGAVDSKIMSVKDGKKGEKGDKGDKGDRGRDGSPDNAGQIRDKLEILKEDDRLDKNAVKGLEDYEEVVKSSKQKQIFSIGGGSRNAVEFTDLSSQLNGVLKTFYVPKRRFIALFGTQFPVIYRPDIDYTGSGTGTLTLTSEVSAPASGQTLILLHSRI